ncbi:hypothetical protein CDD82_2359 [Ophiocordyceps australis]|uniref:LIM zinc-binding domain-containing protein n=1 Tax=Ophiocordyceps australis TaxID=1399860 RepID=A0A2C5ZJT7_9HYPO|nr:hypothetical protein CDD82_2359 [Ophiocordyceps australis]
MGDHVCDGAGAEVAPPPEVEKSHGQPLQSKFGRMPPQVDTSAANRPYMHRGQLTPVSQPSDSRSVSPVIHNGGPSPSLSDDMFAGSSPATARRPGGYGGFNRADGDEGEADEGAVGRMKDRIKALVPGPFDSGLRLATSYSGRQDALPSPDEMGRAMDHYRPGTAGSPVHDGPRPVMTPPKVPRKNGYGGFGPPATVLAEPASPSGYIGRSETFPLPSPRLEQAPRLASSNAAGEDGERKKSMGPDRTRKPPPRISLLTQHRPRHASSSVDLAAEFGIGNPYSTSAGSPSPTPSPFGGSYASPISTSTVTSPAPSPRSPSSPRLQKPVDGKLRKAASPRLDRFDPAVQSGQAEGPVSPTLLSPRKKQGGGLMGLFRDRDRERDRERERQRQRDGDRELERERQKERVKARARADAPLPAPALPYRGECKACGLAIRGKSISSADGRLSGKYHKACFVCTTCTEPFLSTEFYVLGDHPYCEQHYHKLNGSLCGSCGRGIEGQYLEDEARTKYHLGCFRCLDCHMSLVDGYFEVDGRAYCERDAYSRSAPLPPDLDMPSPRTRLPPRGPAGLPGRPAPRPAATRPPPVSGKRLAPAMGFPPRPRMNKRMTRLGQM